MSETRATKNTPGEGRRLLGQILKARGSVRESQIQEALAEQRKHGGLIGQCLVSRGACAQKDVTVALADQAGLEIVDLDKTIPEKAALALVDASMAHTFGVLPLRVEGKTLIVALSDPLNTAVIEDLRFTTGVEVRAALAEDQKL